MDGFALLVCTDLNKLVVKYDCENDQATKNKELSVTNICNNMIGKK